MKKLEQAMEALATAMHYVAGAAVFSMMILTCLDVVLRKMRIPMPGTYELVAYLSGVAVAFAMAHTTMGKGHVAVSILVRRFPKRVQNIIDACTSLLGCLLFAVASWKVLLIGWDYQQSGQVSMTLEMPVFPVAYAIGIALVAVSLGLLLAFVKHTGRVVGKWG